MAFSIAPGERVGLLGPNGAGKSTLMRILCGFLPLRGAGRALVAGKDVNEEPLAVRECVGYLPELVPLYRELRVWEHLDYRAQIKGLRRRERRPEIERVAEKTGLRSMLETPIGRLSRGYRQRVGIADALLGEPPLVVLDEPTVGLDPNQVQSIRSMLKELGGGQTLLFSSHILAEVEVLCDRVIVLSRGEVVLDESMEQATRSEELVVELATIDGAKAREIVTAASTEADVETRITSVTTLDDRTRIRLNGSARELSAAIGRASLAAQTAVLRLEPGRRRLEERFAWVTGATEDQG